MSTALILPGPGPQTPVFREAPHNLEAEQALLGAILVNNEAIDRGSNFLKPGDFYDALHARIYEAAEKLIWSGKRAPPIPHPTPADPGPPGLRDVEPGHEGDAPSHATTIINA